MQETPPDLVWVVPDVLATMGRPSNLRKALETFKEAGIAVIVSLTETELSPAVLAEFDVEYHHLPVRDFGAPTPEQIDRFVSTVQRARKAGVKTLVHCFAGRGRSGTMAACYLVSLGRSADEALDEVRALRPGAIETPEQEEAVRDYARHVGRQRGRGGRAE
jgi:atypical dual specificity phosphatase